MRWSWFVDRDIARALYGVEGVAKVNRIGGMDRQVRVDLDPDGVAGLGRDRSGSVRSSSPVSRWSARAAKAEIGGDQQTIRTVGTVQDVAALRDYTISFADGRSVRLSAIAKVSDGAADPSQVALLDGKPVVGFSVSRSRGADELKVAAAVEQALAELAQRIPAPASAWSPTWSRRPSARTRRR
jgi:multidrug efflux pump subunit AcrB